jgi:hypothetical protein
LGSEICLRHTTKLEKRTFRGPTFLPVRGGLPENKYRDKDEEERKGEEREGGGNDETEGDKERETNNEKKKMKDDEYKENEEAGKKIGNKVNLYLPSLRMKVPDHLYIFGSLLLQ